MKLALVLALLAPLTVSLVWAGDWSNPGCKPTSSGKQVCTTFTHTPDGNYGFGLTNVGPVLVTSVEGRTMDDRTNLSVKLRIGHSAEFVERAAEVYNNMVVIHLMVADLGRLQSERSFAVRYPKQSIIYTLDGSRAAIDALLDAYAKASDQPKD